MQFVFEPGLLVLCAYLRSEYNNDLVCMVLLWPPKYACASAGAMNTNILRLREHVHVLVDG